MTEYIEKAALYSALADLEGEAMKKYMDFSVSNPPIATEWERIMNERTRIKHLVADFSAYNIDRDKIEDLVSSVQTIDVAPRKTGKWEQVDRGRTYECSSCGALVNVVDPDTYFYCPNCGAEMDEG